MKNLVMRNHRGSHVGVVVSFMIFVTFVLFVIVLLEPSLTTNPDKKSMLESVEKKIIDGTSYQTIVVTVTLENSISETCVSIGSFISDFDGYEGIVVKNKNGDLISSSLSSSDLNTLQIKRNTNSENFFKIYSSDGFGDGTYETVSCRSITESTDYTIAMTKEQSYVFESKVEDLINDYSNYNKFKESLNLPNGTDVGFSFEFENGTIISTNETSVTTNIFVKEKTVEYLDENSNVLSGKLKTRIW